MKTTHDVMRCIPHKLHDHEIDPETGRIVVLKPKFQWIVAKKLIEPLLQSKFFKVKLDPIGSAVWENINGVNTVDAIGKILASQFGPEIEPIYERLTKFVVALHQQKFIRLDCPVDETDSK